MGEDFSILGSILGVLASKPYTAFAHNRSTGCGAYSLSRVGNVELEEREQEARARLLETVLRSFETRGGKRGEKGRIVMGVRLCIYLSG